MLLSLATTKAGAALLIMLGALVGWAETAYHESLLKDKISTLAILLAETTVFLAILGIWALCSKDRVRRLSGDIYRLTHGRWVLFAAFALVGLVGAYTADAALVTHGTGNMRLAGLIVGIGVTAGLYIVSVEKGKALKSLLWLTGMVICAELAWQHLKSTRLLSLLYIR